MDIAFAFDANYAEPARVAIESILDTHPGAELTFWLGAPEALLKELEHPLRRQCDGRASLRLLPIDDAVLDMPVSADEATSYITAGMYLRLFLPELLPRALRRILYLDCDTLVCGDLSPLWTVPLRHHVLGAVRDAHIATFAGFDGIPGAGEYPPDAPYFNSGVLLINLGAWRRARVTERCVAYLNAHAGRLRLPDQDALNLAAHNAWLRLPHTWNHMRSWRLEPTMPDHVVEDARILHFAGHRKPWTDEFVPGWRLDRYRRLLHTLP